MISSAQIGYDEPDFEKDVCGCNLRAIAKHVNLARQQADGGLIGVNVMVALKHYKDHVKAAVRAGADQRGKGKSGAGPYFLRSKYRQNQRNHNCTRSNA